MASDSLMVSSPASMVPCSASSQDFYLYTSEFCTLLGLE
jgi:hypothetical protein